MSFFNRSQHEFQRSNDGIFDSLRDCAATWISLFRTRLEIFATELEEEKIRLGHILGLAILALFCLFMGLIMLTFFVIVCFWETPYRLWAAGGVVVVYLLGVLGCGWGIRRKLNMKPRLFDATLQELAKDEKHLTRNLS